MLRNNFSIRKIEEKCQNQQEMEDKLYLLDMYCDLHMFLVAVISSYSRLIYLQCNFKGLENVAKT